MTITVPPCIQEQVVETEGEVVLSQSHEGEQMTIAETDHVPPHNQGEVIVAEGEVMSSQDEQMTITATDPLSPHTQEHNFVLTDEKLTWWAWRSCLLSENEEGAFSQGVSRCD